MWLSWLSSVSLKLRIYRRKSRALDITRHNKPIMHSVLLHWLHFFSIWLLNPKTGVKLLSMSSCLLSVTFTLSLSSALFAACIPDLVIQWRSFLPTSLRILYCVEETFVSHCHCQRFFTRYIIHSIDKPR